MKRLIYILSLSLLTVAVNAQTIKPGPQAAKSAFITLSTNTTTQVIALPTTGTFYVTAIQLNTRTAGTATTVQIVYGTGSNCATGTTALTPVYANTAAGVQTFLFDHDSPLVPARVTAICAVQAGTTPGTTDVLVAGFNAP